MRRKIYNLTLHQDDSFNKLTIGSYTFYPMNATDDESSPSMRLYTSGMITRYNRNHKLNAVAEFSGRQRDSILYKGGLATRYTRRKRLEDILTIGSLLSGRNIELSSRRSNSRFPLASSNHLENVSWTWSQFTKDTKKILCKINSQRWLNKYDRGFHLIMLLNHSNIHLTETRFLSMMIIWEWLFAKEFGRESFNLREIISSLLQKSWPRLTNSRVFDDSTHNIFSVLRNQLAHSGQLPIDRSYAETWMKNLKWKSIEKYCRLLTQLTQILVFSTMDIDLIDRKCFKVLSVDVYLKEFLKNGRVNRFER